MPMTPDEVVDTLKEMQKNLFDAQALTPIGTRNLQALTTAITLIKDYQKLRGRISVEEIKKELDDEHIHIINTNLAKRIVTYLQQPTEQEEK
jgi:hypothetical protein